MALQFNRETFEPLAKLPAEFARYQTECGQDAHSLVAEPLFKDKAHGDYRQRGDSPCLDMGMQSGASQ